MSATRSRKVSRATLAVPNQKPQHQASPKDEVCNDTVRSVFLCGCETWPVLQLRQMILRNNRFAIKRTQSGNIVRLTSHYEGVFGADWESFEFSS